MCRSFFSQICFLLLALALLAGAAAADPSVQREVLPSGVLGEDRPLNIVLPVDYSPARTYPVVYALDGGADYLPSVAERMQSVQSDLIVVGVENVDRSRDMFPDPVFARDNRGGGGARFLEFLTTELVPHIEAKYATNGFRVLSGQSNSGFFVLYAMLNANQTFDAYLASSPMIGWDWGMIRDGSIELLAGRKSFSKTLYLNRGEEDLDRTANYLTGYVALLREIAPSDFRWMHEIVDGSGHVPEISYRNGIAFIFGNGKFASDDFPVSSP